MTVDLNNVESRRRLGSGDAIDLQFKVSNAASYVVCGLGVPKDKVAQERIVLAGEYSSGFRAPQQFLRSLRYRRLGAELASPEDVHLEDSNIRAPRHRSSKVVEFIEHIGMPGLVFFLAKPPAIRGAH